VTHTAFSPLPRSFSSVFCLRYTCWVLLVVIPSTFLPIIVLVWHFLPSVLAFSPPVLQGSMCRTVSRQEDVHSSLSIHEHWARVRSWHKGVSVEEETHELVCIRSWGAWTWGGYRCECYYDVRNTISRRSPRRYIKGSFGFVHCHPARRWRLFIMKE
jgi:hypothetical protein